jgi:hypothetical protein
MQIPGASTELGFETGMTRSMDKNGSVGVGIGIGDQLLDLIPSMCRSGVQG